MTVTDQCFAQMRTGQPHIVAIGDVVGQPMLAHKATHEAKVACGHKAAFNPAAIPSVAYTDPEIAWAGLTETQAKAEGARSGWNVPHGQPRGGRCRWAGPRG